MRLDHFEHVPVEHCDRETNVRDLSPRNGDIRLSLPYN